jgi:hypothetical protein
MKASCEFGSEERQPMGSSRTYERGHEASYLVVEEQRHTHLDVSGQLSQTSVKWHRIYRGVGHPPIIRSVCEHSMTAIAVVYTPTPKTIDR